MLRLALIQSPGSLLTKQARLNWLRQTLPQVAAERADIVVLPELFACGYNIGDAIPQAAEAPDGPTFKAMADLAIEFGLAIHYGFAERAADGLYNSAICLSKNGALLCHQRKLNIPPGFEREYFSPGKGSAMFTLGGLKVATLICYDAEFPETVRHVAEEGADLVLVPTALGNKWAWVAQKMIPTRAYENGIYLAYANHTEVENGMTYLGESVIAGPDGVEEARAGQETAVLFAEIDKDRITAAQQRLPYLVDRRKMTL